MHAKRPTRIKTLRHEFDLSRPALALALSAAISAPALAAGNPGEDVALDTLVIEGKAAASERQPDANPYAEEGAPYKAKKVQDVRHTRDIADTPQTMTVLTRDSITDSGKTELKDILSAQPGITLGTGEGGNSFGDRYIIRGYEARSDVFTDGLREPGLISRETFALEQVEISKGPSSSFAGRGSTGGAVNMVTKKASLEDSFSTVEAGIGTDNNYSTTLDTNQVLTDRFALRFNAMYRENDTPNREPAGEQRDGALLSGVFQATDDLKLSGDYYYTRSDDRTDPGIAFDGTTGKFRKYDYVGQDGLDFQKTEADIFTFGVDYRINDEMRLENKSRIGSTSNAYIISAYSRRSGSLRPFSGWQENDYLGNQTNLVIDKELFGTRNTLIAGIEYANEKTDTGNYTVTTSNSFTLDPYNASHSLWQGSTKRNSAAAKVKLETVSAYLMDTITLNEDWEVFGGLRLDSFDYEMFRPTNSTSGTAAADYQFSDSYWNGHFGVTWSPWEHGNVYATVSTASEMNAAEADAGTNCGYGGLCIDSNGGYKADPEQSTNYELGTKWNLFDEQLLLTMAVFQTTKDKVIEGGTNSYTPTGSLNTGKNRVEGVEFGLSGNITDKLSGQAGLAIMNSKTLASYDPTAVGKPKANFAEKSANAQLRYQLTPKFHFGGTVTYSSEIYGGQPDAGANTSIVLPSYTVVDLFAGYQFNDQLSLRVNLQNVADKEYYTAIYRGGSIVYLGDARSSTATLQYKF